jgi:hypothetical protein
MYTGSTGSSNNTFLNLGGGIFTGGQYTLPGSGQQLWWIDCHAMVNGVTGANISIDVVISGVGRVKFMSGALNYVDNALQPGAYPSVYFLQANIIRWFAGGSVLSFVVTNNSQGPITFMGNTNVDGTTLTLLRLA